MTENQLNYFERKKETRRGEVFFFRKKIEQTQIHTKKQTNKHQKLNKYGMDISANLFFLLLLLLRISPYYCFFS